MTNATTYPTDQEWTPADAIAAESEGWGVFDSEGSENGRTQLCRWDELEIFDGDAEVWTFIVNHACTGSALHMKALRLVAEHNPVEWECISRTTGYRTEAK